MDIKIAGKFRLGELIGKGSFGEVFIGTDIKTREEVAIKLESCDAENTVLPYESKVYKKIAGTGTAVLLLTWIEGIPRMVWSGEEGNYNVMVMELLGPSIQDLFEYSGNCFPMNILLVIAKQMIQRVQYIHSKNYIHRDLKPENFLIGLGKKEGTIHLIDYGIAKRYIVTATGEHIKFKTHKKFVGVARYASLNSHTGLEQSRRDDMEAIGHILIYFMKGSLPWQGVERKPGEGLERAIYRKKSETTVEELCVGLPEEFAEYMRYSRGLEFTQAPDYDYLLKLFGSLQEKLGLDATVEQIDWSCLKKVEFKKSKVIEGEGTAGKRKDNTM